MANPYSKFKYVLRFDATTCEKYVLLSNPFSKFKYVVRFDATTNIYTLRPHVSRFVCDANQPNFLVYVVEMGLPQVDGFSPSQA
jgi:hypothetical protein